MMIREALWSSAICFPTMCSTARIALPARSKMTQQQNILRRSARQSAIELVRATTPSRFSFWNVEVAPAAASV